MIFVIRIGDRFDISISRPKVEANRNMTSASGMQKRKVRPGNRPLCYFQLV